jgi:hypothetical protein
MRRGAGLLAALALALAGAGCGGGGDEAFEPLAAEDPGPIHVHALGVDPADGALFIATHTGLWRVAGDETKAERVGDLYQDTMAFTVAGPGRFLGSGHPDLREAREKKLPPHLGLIESRDGGETWAPVSLLGEADFHILRFAGERVFAYDATNDRLMVSGDDGASWTERSRPAPLVDLALDPGSPDHLVASSEHGLHESRDAGSSWIPLFEGAGLLAWPAPERLYLVVAGGLVFSSADGGRSFQQAGALGGEPAALLALSAQELYVALHDGTILRSTDGGASWAVRSRP